MLTAAMAAPLFDEAQIDLLRDAIGEEDLYAMLSEFPPAGVRMLAAVEAAVAADDFDQARASAHNLKGCASSFGVAQVADLAREIELELPSIEAIRLRLPALVESLNLTAAALAECSGAATGDSGPDR
jgi:HPt (histidine-containing phosphotransfer) domain-containing protein